jgi:DNA-binding response OmpR family regulator
MPMEATMGKQLTALLVMNQERRSALADHLISMDATVLTAGSCGEAARVLRDEPEVRLVVTDLVLPDGSWFDVLNRVGDARGDATVVVAARVADERLWTQVLEAGGFDLLVEPYQGPEVQRILAAATTPHLHHRLAAAS